MNAWRVARLVAAKDLRVEWHSRVLLNQVIPFAAIMMVLFAFAIDSNSVLNTVAPGLIWLATLFSILVVVQRTFAVETADGALDALLVAGVRPTGLFLGKSVALAAQLLVLELVLVLLAVVLYTVEPPAAGIPLLAVTLLAATTGLAFVGTLYGGLAAGSKGKETLLPLLLLPVVAPVLIAATRATEAALGSGDAAVHEGWPWVGFLVVFGASFGAVGTWVFGPLIEE